MKIDLIKYYMKHPIDIILKLDNIGVIRLSDENYIKFQYRSRLGKNINLKDPRTFNEKLNWLKLHDKKDIYTKMVDKYEAKDYVSKKVGEEYIIPTLGIYDSFDEIEFEKLPNQFVIKCTHDCGGLVVVRDKSKLDIKKARKKINKCLKYSYYWFAREWPYKNVKPRIIVEKYMEDAQSQELIDYKFFCFNGVPKLIYVSKGLENHSTATISFYDMDFNLLPLKRKDFAVNKEKMEKPKNFEKMKEIAEKLSKEAPQQRVDLYEINGKIYFGELTFYTCAGYIPFEDKEWDKKLGDMLIIPSDLKK